MSIIQHDSEVLAEGQQVITACALIHKKADGIPHVFLARRAETKKFLPEVYEIPGGHIDFGEDIEKGLKREIKEEMNVEIALGMPFSAFTYMNDVKKSHSVEVIYFASLKEDENNIALHLEDHSSYIWVNEKNISDIYSEQKGSDDVEFQVVSEGLRLLTGGKLKI